MFLDVVDNVSVASGSENEDRAGVASPLVWVIDGATDVIPEPLTPAPSDAAWFAQAMHETLAEISAAPPSPLSTMPDVIATRLATRFAAETRRAPSGRDEHPSAAAIVARLAPNADSTATLDYVSLGDCILLVEHGGLLARVGVDEEEAGDRWVREALATKPNAPRMTRADLWPQLRAKRASMNHKDGYPIFSVTAPPPDMILHGSIAVAPGARILMATDGLVRLVDVFGRYTAESLFAAAWENGLSPLVDELRALETSDSDCTRYPRAKVSDDTTAVLLRVTALAP